MRGRGRAWAVALAVAAILSPACRARSGEARIRSLLEEAVERAAKRDEAGLTRLLAPEYEDFEGRDAARTGKLLRGFFDRYRGIVVHLLGVRIGPAAADGRVPVECEVSLSHGAAEVLRKLVRFAGTCYRFRLEVRPEPRAGWRFVSAAWEEVGPAGLFPESLDILKGLFPGV
ncbi:MAG TPA: hypothetical protein P5119_07990 [Candidatus Aminicenantes bacterium]|nr:hypothetical protein [Candidatus Aminicenantes bacterium]HRY65266.1 hypothetical protein [Candidatus Aminicenantes bacterium]HRZ72266.1 hypothetical protein [Candidatus Aminicenantes bacterium]